QVIVPAGQAARRAPGVRPPSSGCRASAESWLSLYSGPDRFPKRSLHNGKTLRTVELAQSQGNLGRMRVAYPARRPAARGRAGDKLLRHVLGRRGRLAVAGLERLGL